MLFLGVVAVLLLSACGSAASSVGPANPGAGMMGGGSGMDGGSGYNFSGLSCAAPPALPGATVTVTLGDMGMTQMMSGTAPLGATMMLRATPTSVTAGEVNLVVSNMGRRTHELVVLPLTAGGDAGQRVPGADGRVDEDGSLGEVSDSCAEGAGDGITASSIGWATLTLPVGRYELVCDLENHYSNGMYQELDVT